MPQSTTSLLFEPNTVQKVEQLAQRIPNAPKFNRLKSFITNLLAGTPILADSPYQQNPHSFGQQLFYPGLSRKPWFTNAEIPAISEVEALFPKIQQEVHEKLDRTLFTTYQEPWGNLFDKGHWLVAPFYRENEPIAEAHKRFPVTSKFLQSLPRHKPNFSTFSFLRPQTHIVAHHGITNMRVRVQLGILVPPGCALQVGKVKREMTQGEAWAFDDSFLHEAWNPSDEARLILSFDVWHPYLDDQEISYLHELLGYLEKHPINQQWLETYHGGDYDYL